MKPIYIIFFEKFILPQLSIDQLTHFKENILSGMKLHTIQSDSSFWRRQLIKILNHDAYLSLRSIPNDSLIHSSQEFLRLYRCSYELLDKINGKWYLNKLGTLVNPALLAVNEGLSLSSFNSIFPHYDYDDLIIIHLTPFRYSYLVNVYGSIRDDSIADVKQLSLFDIEKIEKSEKIYMDKHYHD